MKILGISCFYHDGAAALIEDGVVVAAAEEERFSRVKHDSSFPKNAINFCLKNSKIKSGDLDWVVFYEKPFLKFERITLSHLATAPLARSSFVNAYKTWFKDKLWIKVLLSSYLKVPSQKIVFSLHHLSHGASSFYTSPFKRAAILTCDGVGEWTTTAWGKGKDNKLNLDYEVRFPHSLGLFYSTFTQFLGFEINEGEYKVMGLAPYGKPTFKSKVEKLIEQSSDGSFKLNLDYFNFHKSDKTTFNQKFIDLFKLNPRDAKMSEQISQDYADLAASAQKVLEDKLVKIAKYLKNQTGEENLCYAGGVALNGVANWRIFKEAGFKNIFIHPAAGDSGGALGAALYFYHHVLGKKRRSRLTSVYLGQENSEEDVRKFLKKLGIKVDRLTDQKLLERVVDLLKEKKVLGWVQGRFEWGPRALGARSILADPRDKKMKDLVNSKIKFREGFRPFAPSVVYEEGLKYFEVGDRDQAPLEYMLAVIPVKTRYQAKLSATTHVDGSARPQFVKKDLNPRFYNLIKNFGQETGIPVLLNTSFNLKGEPIVNTCEEAYETFVSSGLDGLVLGNYLIVK